MGRHARAVNTPPDSASAALIPVWAAFRRAGVTLIELLVAVAGVAVLMAILLPVVAHLRERARLVACTNQTAQVAKGFSAYDASRSQLPGWRNALGSYTTAHAASTAPNGNTTPCVSWTVMILPFIGEQEIYNWYDTYSATRIADDATKKRVALFLCPTMTSIMKSPSPLCYFANGGTGAMSLDKPGGHRQYGRQFTGDGVCLDAAGNLPSHPWHSKTGGCDEYVPGRYSLSEIAEGDGTSNTLLIAERTGPDSPVDVSWADNPLSPPNNSNNPKSLAAKSTHAVLHSRGIHPGYGAPGGGESIHATMNTWMKVRGDNGLRYPSSRHEGGSMMAFCDGHVKFVSDSINEWVYTQLMTSNHTDMSFRVGMFEKVAQPDGTLVPAVYSEADLDGQP